MHREGARNQTVAGVCLLYRREAMSHGCFPRDIDSVDVNGPDLVVGPTLHQVNNASREASKDGASW